MLIFSLNVDLGGKVVCSFVVLEVSLWSVGDRDLVLLFRHFVNCLFASFLDELLVKMISCRTGKSLSIG